MTLTARGERFCLCLLLAIFIYFTAHGLAMFYSGDDMMNMYGAWNVNPWRLARSILLVWVPVYRPMGGAIYRVFYAIFGFHNLPLYIFCWLILVLNVVLCYRFFRAMGASAMAALTALSLTLVHGNFQDLYLSAGTIYDRFWFLFTALGLIVYARMKPSLARGLWVALICLLSMSSKESGVALPALLLCYEAIFVWRGRPIREWLMGAAPLFAGLLALALIFVWRVGRTPELANTGAYHPQASLGVWLTHMGEYLALLVYRSAPFSAWTAAGILLVSAAISRNRMMLFGWIFFVITLTPVALISTRPGYVLYVPDIGLGLYLAGVFSLLPLVSIRLQMASFLLVTAGITWFHARHWPGPFPPEASPEKRFTEQFRREYPRMPANSRLLFVSDDFPRFGWDLEFNIWLLYADRSIVVQRMMGPPDQQPKPGEALRYDHVFALEDGHFQELDGRNVEESTRLHILRNYAVGREMDFGRADYGAYEISGVMDGDRANPSRWTEPVAKLKYDLYPAPAIFSMRFYVPEVVSKPPIRTLRVLAGGAEIGRFPLLHDGIFEVKYPVAPGRITLNGFTVVEMRVDHPYKNAEGQEFGVVLMRAGFEYAK